MHIFARHHACSTSYPNLLQQKSFVGSNLKDQPQKDIYTPNPRPKAWFEKGLLTAAVGGTGYINLANKAGYGFWHRPVDYKEVPRIIDRSSPLMWI